MCSHTSTFSPMRERKRFYILQHFSSWGDQGKMGQWVLLQSNTLCSIPFHMTICTVQKFGVWSFFPQMKLIPLFSKDTLQYCFFSCNGKTSEKMGTSYIRRNCVSVHSQKIRCCQSRHAPELTHQRCPSFCIFCMSTSSKWPI